MVVPENSSVSSNLCKTQGAEVANSIPAHSKSRGPLMLRMKPIGSHSVSILSLSWLPRNPESPSDVYNTLRSTP